MFTTEKTRFNLLIIISTVMVLFLAACGGGGGDGGGGEQGGGGPITSPTSLVGQLDATFGTNGRVVTPFASSGDLAHAVAVQPDGKIVVAGEVVDGGRHLFALERHNADGSFDSGFRGTGSGGLFVISGLVESAWALAIQPDGKIVAAGIASNGNDFDFALVRFQSDGTLDSSFGSGGKVTTPIGSSDDIARALALQPDGKIVLAGSSYNGTNYDFSLVRYQTDGSLDSGFGSGGKVVTPIGASNDTLFAMALQPDGKIVVGGGIETGAGSSNFDFGLVRYDATGGLDATFGLGGKVIDAIGTSHDFIRAVAVQSDGKIVAGGFSYNGAGSPDFAVVRYNANGGRDTSFGGSGQGKIVTAIGPAGDVITSLMLQGNKIIVGGFVNDGSKDQFALARYTNQGLLDTSFGQGGAVVTSVGNGTGQVEAIALRSDGGVITAGTYWNGKNSSFALLEYGTDGSIQSDFGAGGGAIYGFLLGDDRAFAVAIQSDGKIVAGGDAYNGTDGDFAVARYNSDGSLDTNFGVGGRVFTDFGAGDDAITGIAIQSDGKIVAAGSAYNGSDFDFALARFQPDGSLDSTFGSNGLLTTAFGSGDDRIFSMILDPEGKIVVAGAFYNGTDQDFALARYNGDGSLDTAFGQQGKVMTGIGSGDDIARSVRLQSNGKIVVAGFSKVGNLSQLALVRYNHDGSLDATFGLGGKVTTDIGSGEEVASAMQIQADDKIVVAGGAFNGTDGDFAVIRYTANGALDSSFGTNGVVMTAIGTGQELATAMVIQADGRIVIAGGNLEHHDGFGLIRYLSDGSLDTSFGQGGKVTTLFGSADFPWGLALQSDGKIVAVGTSSITGFDYDFVLARYNGA